jgi:transcriptional regulator with XRE-family HTH domain
MERSEEVASHFGIRLRRARHRLGRSQALMATDAGTSQPTWSRLERGQGAGVPLSTWVDAADAAGVDLFPVELASPSFDRGMQRLLEAGGWAPGERIGAARCYDREPRPRPGLRGILPAERAVVLVVPILIDERAESRLLRDVVSEVRARSAPDRSVAGVLLVTRDSANRRMAGDPNRHSDGQWLSALRDPGVAMPLRSGWVWLAPRGTHLLPGG